MIQSIQSISSEQVAQHYDELDEIYRQVWSHHLHHGFFESIWDSKKKATERLVHKVAKLAHISKERSVCDIGCGYGATAELLARDYGAHVVGVTISPKQYQIAQNLQRRQKGLEIRLANWLENGFPNSSFDHLISIESSEHMPDKNRFFQQARRVLKRKGNFVICAWLMNQNASQWERDHLLEPICREGRLPSMGSEEDYRKMFSENDFEIQAFSDISQQVKWTWSLSILNLARHFTNHPKDVRMLWPRFNSNARFAMSLFRILLAYETGAMRYGVFKALLK